MKKVTKQKILIALLSSIVASNTYAAAYDPFIVAPFKPSSYPKMYKVWGEEWMKKINQMKPEVADYVAAQKNCDKLDDLGLSEPKSIPKKEPVFFADCRNGQRFYVSHSDVINKKTILTQQQKAMLISDTDAINACERELKSKLVIPQSYDRKSFSTSVYRAQTTGNVVVNFDFKAMNNLGMNIPKSGRCVIDGSKVEVTVK